ncbi:hypothetical protein LLH06_03660 [Mucilaginibacter daejeonensis]|uniref:hypothetical protein n=1 Tax=Mucilaginibacter daejeonensis TaxID=398049 RepID=UPI001D171C92|nr:hypothetical protein [Mucilaginibacter daejeonensis]UEG54066.1 hypothetical protein LLH06_03660 [Mucilaginibacter daejeonensis]
MKYELEKTLWTGADYEQMGWHDARVHGISFGKNYQLLLDIDYIFEWVHPKEGETFFKFWIAPCTLIFENVYKLAFDLELSVPSEMYIDGIVRSKESLTPNGVLIEYDWQIDFDGGGITFNGTDFNQHVRCPPQLTEVQELDIISRGGVSFSTVYSSQS